MPDDSAAPKLTVGRLCARCQSPLSRFGGSEAGLCPRCLMDAALIDGQTGASDAVLDQQDGDGPGDWLEALGTPVDFDPIKGTATRPKPVFFGRYELLEEIARGGQGQVYRARERETQRVVALKMILPLQAAVHGTVERFRAEAKAVASLDHPHILPMYEVGERDGLPFFSMKLAEGGTLASRLTEFQNDSRAAARLLAQVARAVDHAHRRGVLHRDLKPGNILLDVDGRWPFVADFGLAKCLESDNPQTLTHAALGTPDYVAPEQAAGREADLTVAVDIYSLGAIFYELLARRRTFTGESVLEVLRQVSDATPVPPRTLNPGVPRDLEVICLKCLEKSPATRYGSAMALADDLESWLADRAIRARPVGAFGQLTRWARRNPALAAITALLLLVLSGVAIGSVLAAARLATARDRALAAEADATEKLRASSLAQARATRLTGRLGQRFDTLAALKKAAAIRPDAELRTEAIAALALPDLRLEHGWSDRFVSNSPAAFDATLSRYVAETSGGGLSLRRAADQSEIARLAVPAGQPRAIYVAPWNADSAVAVRFANDVVRVYESRAGGLRFELTDRPVCANVRQFAYDFTFTPDGRELAVGLPSGGVSFHDAATGRETGRLPSGTVPAVIAVSPDGRKVALVARQSGSLEVYDRASGRLERTLAHPKPVDHVIWRPGDSGTLAAACLDDDIYLWDAASGEALQTLRGHEGAPTLLAFHPDGRVLASAARDRSVRLWDVENGACLLNAAGLYGEPCLRFSRDGRHLAVGGEATGLSTYEVALDTPCRTFARVTRGDWYSRASGMSVSPDGRCLLLCLRAGGLRLFSTGTGERLGRVLLPANEKKTALFTPLGNAIICSGEKTGVWKHSFRWGDPGAPPEIGPAEPLDTRPGFLLTDVQGEPPVAALAGVTPGRFSLLPLADPTHPRDLPVASLPAGIFLTPDARLAATCDWEADAAGESDVRLWDTGGGSAPLRRLGAGANNSVRFSPSGRLLIACGGKDGAGLWQIPSLARDPRLTITDADDAWFTPDENFLALLRDDGLAFVRLEDGALLATFPGEPTMSVSFTPDGRKMFIGFEAGIFGWDLAALRAELAKIRLDWTDGASRPEKGR